MSMAPVSTPTTSAAALEQTFGEIPSNVGDGYQIESVRISRIRNRDGDWSAMLKFSRCETFRKKETDMGIDKQPVLGIIQLDSAHAMEGASGDVIERSDLMPFSIGDPSLWHLPLQSVIAKRADIIANKVPTPEAVSGILEAVGRLDPHVLDDVYARERQSSFGKRKRVTVATPTSPDVAGVVYLTRWIGVCRPTVGRVAFVSALARSTMTAKVPWPTWSPSTAAGRSSRP